MLHILDVLIFYLSNFNGIGIYSNYLEVPASVNIYIYVVNIQNIVSMF